MGYFYKISCYGTLEQFVEFVKIKSLFLSKIGVCSLQTAMLIGLSFGMFKCILLNLHDKEQFSILPSIIFTHHIDKKTEKLSYIMIHLILYAEK